MLEDINECRSTCLALKLKVVVFVSSIWYLLDIKPEEKFKDVAGTSGSVANQGEPA